MSRPTNADLGRQSRDRRVPVLLTDEEYAEIEEAADREGLRVGPYIRSKALAAVRAK